MRNENQQAEQLNYMKSNQFHVSNSCKHYLEMDNGNKIFRLNNSLYRYSDLLKYDIKEESSGEIKNCILRAFVCSLFLGIIGVISGYIVTSNFYSSLIIAALLADLGAILGFFTGSRICNSLSITVSVKNHRCCSDTIVFVSGGLRVNSDEYGEIKSYLIECASMLDNIICENNNIKDSISEADEIMRFKALLDQGIITQEQFEAKKNKILGL